MPASLIPSLVTAKSGGCAEDCGPPSGGAPDRWPEGERPPAAPAVPSGLPFGR